MIPHLSYSQYNSYVSCPRSWFLSKIRQAEEKQSWYSPIGNAVHEMIEAWLQEQSLDAPALPSAEKFFYPLVAKQLLIEPDTSKWLAGGPSGAPVVEEKALQLVKDCFEKALEYLDEIDVWEVEYDASGRLPGLSVPLKAYVDIIGEHKKKGPVIWDWKTGSSKPGSFQLETYAALLKSAHLNRFPSKIKWLGRYVMLAPDKPVTRHVDLQDVEPALIGAKYQKVLDQMNLKLYGTNAGFRCKYCGHQDNCNVNAGKNDRTDYYDLSSQMGYPF
jgi:RecB family exonuclease